MTLKTPPGTYGLIVTPWGEGEPYAVAANWADATTPVYSYGAAGWTQTGRHVADYHHLPLLALEDEITAAIRASGDDLDEREVESICLEALDIDDGEPKP